MLLVVWHRLYVRGVMPQPPVLEEWEEVAGGNGMGSFRGKVYGQRGLADGTTMTTAPIDVAGRRIEDQVMPPRLIRKQTAL